MFCVLDHCLDLALLGRIKERRAQRNSKWKLRIYAKSVSIYSERTSLLSNALGKTRNITHFCLLLLFDRYLSARCQLYQTFHFAREGGQHRRSVTERVTSIRGASSVRGRPLPSALEQSGEIHQSDSVPASGGVLPEPRSEDREASGSSTSGGGQVFDGASTLSRSVEVKILHKISAICEPFSQLPDNSLVMSGLFASSRAS